MGRTAGRTPDQTRRQILDATASVVRQHGLGATLDDIADAAGVSKGGLIYHFASKDALLLALTRTLLEDFRSAVSAAIDPDDHDPGRLTRGYLRASFDPSLDERTVRDAMVLIAQLITDDTIASLAAEDSRRWSTELADDGLPAEVSDLVVAAADGVGMTAIWGGALDRSALASLHDRLLAITRDRRIWAALAEPAE